MWRPDARASRASCGRTAVDKGDNQFDVAFINYNVVFSTFFSIITISPIYSPNFPPGSVPGVVLYGNLQGFMFLRVAKKILLGVVSARGPGIPNHQVQTSSETELCFGHGCCGERMQLEHERNYALGMDALGMDALVIACTWNTNGTMLWAWMLR